MKHKIKLRVNVVIVGLGLILYFLFLTLILGFNLRIDARLFHDHNLNLEPLFGLLFYAIVFTGGVVSTVYFIKRRDKTNTITWFVSILTNLLLMGTLLILLYNLVVNSSF